MGLNISIANDYIRFLSDRGRCPTQSDHRSGALPQLQLVKYDWRWSACDFCKSEYDMGVSENSGTPKSSVLTGFSIFNHPFWGTPNLVNMTYIQ